MSLKCENHPNVVTEVNCLECKKNICKDCQFLRWAVCSCCHSCLGLHQMAGYTVSRRNFDISRVFLRTNWIILTKQAARFKPTARWEIIEPWGGAGDRCQF